MVILLIITLVFLIISDFKSHYVYIWQIILFGITQFIYCFLTLEKGVLVQNILLNNMFLLVLFLSVGIYVFFRFREKKDLIGWGDILFIVCLVPYFSFNRFLYFMIISLVFSLGYWAISYLFGQRSREIPLISTLGICYSILLIYDNVIAK